MHGASVFTQRALRRETLKWGAGGHRKRSLGAWGGGWGIKGAISAGLGRRCSAKGPAGARSVRREIAWAGFSPILRRTFSPSLFPRAASLGAVSRDCLSHPFSFPP